MRTVLIIRIAGIDGLFTPVGDNPDLLLVFAEAQMQPVFSPVIKTMSTIVVS